MPSPLPPFDLDLLRTFAAIADNGGFTRAAERVGLTQSSVSLQIRKLERGLGRSVFKREGSGRSSALTLTPEGEILLGCARKVLHLCDEARSLIMEPGVDGAVRLGTPEDFATVHLSDVLARFARAYPRVALDVTCDFTVTLLDGFAKGQYDLILFKREPQGRRERGSLAAADGTRVWREQLVWASSPRLLLEPDQPLPLVLAPAPDVYRRRALAALDAVGRPWRIVMTSPSLAGLQAAVGAGLGVTVLPSEMVPAGLVRLDATKDSLPDLPDAEIVLYRAPGSASPAVDRLAEHLVHALEKQAERPRQPMGRSA